MSASAEDALQFQRFNAEYVAIGRTSRALAAWVNGTAIAGGSRCELLACQSLCCRIRNVQRTFDGSGPCQMYAWAIIASKEYALCSSCSLSKCETSRTGRVSTTSRTKPLSRSSGSWSIRFSHDLYRTSDNRRRGASVGRKPFAEMPYDARASGDGRRSILCGLMIDNLMIDV
jgi:hypothetical protein